MFGIDCRRFPVFSSPPTPSRAPPPRSRAPPPNFSQNFCSPRGMLAFSLVNRLEQVQKKAARFVSNNYKTSTSTSKLVKSLGWDTLEQRRLLNQSVLFMSTCSGFVFIREHYFVMACCDVESPQSSWIEFEKTGNGLNSMTIPESLFATLFVKDNKSCRPDYQSLFGK